MLRRAGVQVNVRGRWHWDTSVDLTLPSDFGRCLWVSGCFEPNETAFLASVLRPGMTFVDIGANIGLYTLLAAHIVGPEGTLVAVEPSPREQVSLRDNLAANGHVAVRVRTEALGSADGTATLRVTDTAHAGHNTLGAPVYASTRVIDEIEVQVTTFDHLVEDEVLKRIDVVKIDVEGAEQLVLDGAEASLRRFRPIVMLEMQEPSLAALGSSVSEVVSFLESLDYKVLEYSQSSGRPRLRGSQLVSDDCTTGDANVVACPSERVGDLV